MRKKIIHFKGWKLCLVLPMIVFLTTGVKASSHREAPLIAYDPLADNTDVYAFRSPDDTTKVTIIADYIPFQLPEGGPNYYTFGQNIRYEIHIKNKTTTTGDDFTYRFTFFQSNQDTATHFNIRLGNQNLRTVYMCQKSTDGGNTFTTIVDTAQGKVAPNNIGPRSIDSMVGLNLQTAPYENLRTVATATTGEQVFAGPADDPFFVDLGGAFDVGNFRPDSSSLNLPKNTVNLPKDGLARFNVHSIALKIPISSLQMSGKNTTQAVSILDSSFVIGVWASASRQQITTIATDGTRTPSGNWVQVSRLGMPLTNEAVIPIGMKDKWNTVASNSANEGQFLQFFQNPELALYMDQRPPPTAFGVAVPSLNALRIQTKSLGTYDFRNGQSGLFAARGTAGTAFAEAPAGYGALLLPDNHSPRAVDLLPIFLTGVPNLRPYQLATGKNGNPLATGKPFINNFLPTKGDMLRLNMAVPVTPRNSADFSSLGLVQAAVLGLTDSRFTVSGTALQFIPNMDGFPNGRRLEDDVTTIELQAVSGVVLAAIGLWYDDYTVGSSPSPVTNQLKSVLQFNAGPIKNDTTLRASFPYVQIPWRGYDYTLKPRF